MSTTSTASVATRAEPTARRSLRQADGVRLDIQLLRALAVGIVVAYHFWPERFPGGFVGVDVFFVLSGLLITDHLVRELDATGTIRVARFWARRARRLLPLALLVLVSALALIMLVMPASQQRAGLLGVLWSGLYAQNWALAADATDYLARDQEPLLTQHFWSLSAEEQFYLLWPLLILAAVAIAAKVLPHRLAPRRAVLFALTCILVISLAHSIVFTSTDPGPAYFATTTRAWEFAAGGLLAFVPQGFAWLRHRTAARVAASWLGYGTIAATTLWLPEGAPFPSATAALPVIGTALCLMAGDVRRGDPSLLAGVRPITWIGDVSYGVYLWHWPLLLAAPVLVAQPLAGWQKIVLIAIVTALAAASKRLVEDPVRFAPALRTSTVRSFAIPAVGSLVIGAIVVGGLWSIEARSDAARQQLEAARESGAPSANDPDLPLVPSIEARSSDYGAMYECFDFTGSGLRGCTYGDEDAAADAVHVAAFGDSHMAHLLPALRQAAEARGWVLTTYVGMSCDALRWWACPGGDDVADSITAADYDLVLTSGIRGGTTEVEEITRTWTPMLEAEVPLVPIVDVPLHPESTYTCVDESGGDVTAAAACTTSIEDALEVRTDRMGPLAAEHGIEAIDLTDIFCDASTCQSVVQNVVVYQDSPSSHLTATMSDSIAERLGVELDAAVAARE